MLKTTDRGELMEQARRQADVLPVELASAVNEGTILFRLLGLLIRKEDESAKGLLHADLITEEGRMTAIKQQGRIQGRTEFLEELLDLVLQGAEDGNRERDSEQSGDGSIGDASAS